MIIVAAYFMLILIVTIITYMFLILPAHIALFVIVAFMFSLVHYDKYKRYRK